MAYRGDLLGGIWLAFVGFILRGAAKAAIAQTEVTSRIEGISVADVMERDPVAIPEGASIEQALDEYFLRYRSPWFPVVDAGRHFIGLVDRGAADNVPAVERASSVVGDVLARDSGSLTIREDEPLESVLGNEALRRLGALIATDCRGPHPRRAHDRRDREGAAASGPRQRRYESVGLPDAARRDDPSL